MPALYSPEFNRVTAGTVLTTALRAWHDARTRGLATMPHLSNLLRGPNSALLAPVLHSLFRFYEMALKRRPVISQADDLSEDEALLISLVSCPELCGETFVSSGIAHGFDCALCSARIMLASALPSRLEESGAP